MKVAFDENVPLEMVRIFRQESETALAAGHLVISARDFRPDGEHGDEGWLRRFAEAGGQVVISGDKRMRALAHERAALAEGGLVAYFFEPKWNGALLHVKAAMLVKWWPQISEHMQQAEPGTCWEIPFSWTGGEFRDVSARSSEIVQDRPVKKKKRDRRNRKRKPKPGESATS